MKKYFKIKQNIANRCFGWKMNYFIISVYCNYFTLFFLKKRFSFVFVNIT